MGYDEIVTLVGKSVEIAGITVIVVGIVVETVRFLWRLRAGIGNQYRAYRQGVGRAILLGLEFLVAGDIIRTVVIEPTFRSVGILAIIIAIRTFLSLELELEIEGRWPWQRSTRPDPDDDDDESV